MKIKLVVAGVVFAVLGLVGCADVVEQGDGAAERAVSEAVQESAAGTVITARPPPPCVLRCSADYRACIAAGTDPAVCLGDWSDCYWQCIDQ